MKPADYARRHAPMAWKWLNGKYAPKYASEKLELKTEFQRSCLKSSDLDKLITKLIPRGSVVRASILAWRPSLKPD